MTDWRLASLGELVTIQRGQTYKSQLLGDDGPILLGLASIARNGGFRGDNLRHYAGPSAESLLVKPGDIYASLKDVTQSADLLGAVARLPSGVGLGRLTQDTVRLEISSKEVHPAFLYLSLLTPTYRSYCRSHATGTTNLGLPREDFLAYSIALPPLSEQRRISGVLGALDDLIDGDYALMRGLRQQLAVAFRSLERRGGGTQQLFTEVFDVDFGSPFAGASFTAPGIGLPLLRIRDLKTQRSQIWTTQRLPKDVVVAPGDVLVGMDAEFRPTVWTGQPSLLNQRVLRVKAKKRSLAWAHQALIRPLAHLEGYKSGTTVAHLNKSDLESITVGVPDEPDGHWFDSVAQPLQAAIVDLADEVQTLIGVRDELLPLLMSGRVRVSEVEGVVPGGGDQ